MMKKKKFDCVEMMHKCGQAVQSALAGKTVEEKVAYFQKRTQELRQRIQAAQGRKRSRSVVKSR